MSERRKWGYVRAVGAELAEGRYRLAKALYEIGEENLVAVVKEDLADLGITLSHAKWLVGLYGMALNDPCRSPSDRGISDVTHEEWQRAMTKFRTTHMLAENVERPSSGAEKISFVLSQLETRVDSVRDRISRELGDLADEVERDTKFILSRIKDVE